ncbi:MAG: toll/interleukin-1 receptor domain-containing protein, partial [Acidobacteriaceae bacterium]|nr:toll/interleukin-1 receptor domain-containing protein [Acidobacteriaceae bacterium]
MATAVQPPASVELFYSYAHSDEPLCKELQKHLTALKRAGLISDWYDRKIEPGSEWAAQIHEALERAGIILLLVSADFLASQYISDVELPFALARHNSGRATVIPVLLRPVEWRDTPFAKLQILPSEARPVTLWPNQDEAFSDVAGRLRELLYSHRLQQVTPPKPALSAVAPVSQERILDAAVASSVVIDEPTDLVTLVRTTNSGGLKAILQMDRSYSPATDDVRQSQTFDLDFPSDPSGKPLPATVDLALESPGFDPPRQQRKIRVPPSGDSAVLVFMLTPKRPGALRLNLEVLVEGVEVGSRELLTHSVVPSAAQPSVSYGVVSLPVNTRPIRGPATAARRATAASAPPTAPSPKRMPAPASPPRAGKPSKRGVWIGALSSAAAIALACTTLIWNNNVATVRPAAEGPSPPAPVTVSPQPAPPPTASSQTSAYELRSLKNTLALLHARADKVQTGVEKLRRAQEGSNRHLSPDINASADRLNNTLLAADRAMDSKDANAARRYIDSAEKELGTLQR